MKTIVKGERWDDLYVLNAAEYPTRFRINKVGAEVWHNKLGHPSWQKLLSLKSVDFSS